MYRDRAQISQVGSNPNTSVVSVYQSCIRRNTQQKVSRTYSMKVNKPVISSPLKLRQSACKDTHTHTHRSTLFAGYMWCKQTSE